jgi:hypothetical protein
MKVKLFLEGLEMKKTALNLAGVKCWNLKIWQ